MADGFHRLTQEIRHAHPRLKSAASRDWGARHAQFRSNIRASLAVSIGQESVRDLDQRPRTDGWSISVSHSPEFGGWLAVPKPTRVGFDCEDPRRVRLDAIARVSEPGELNAAPLPAALWCAKEAVFKALDDLQPKVISEIVIGSWQRLPSDQYFFTVRSHADFEGYLCVEKDLVFAAALVSP